MCASQATKIGYEMNRTAKLAGEAVSRLSPKNRYRDDTGFNKRFKEVLNRNQQKKLNEKLGVDVGGEGGEYETLVVDGPVFRKKLVIKESRKVWDGVRGELVIGGVELIDKWNSVGERT